MAGGSTSEVGEWRDVPVSGGGDWQDVDAAAPTPKDDKPGPASRFASSLWHNSIGSMVPLLKRAIGTDELDKAYESVKSGNYADAGHTLFNWAGGLTFDPVQAAGERVGQTIAAGATSKVKQSLQEIQNAGKALKEGRYEEAVVHGATALYPTRADQVKKSVEAVRSGHAPDAIVHMAAAVNQDPETTGSMADAAEQMRGGDVAGGVGTVLGPIVNAGLAVAGSSVPEEAAANIPTPIKSSLTADEQAAIDFAHERNIPLSAATETGNKFVQSAQKVAASQPLGAGVSKAASEATRRALVKTGADLVNQAGAETVAQKAARAGFSKVNGEWQDAAGNTWTGEGEPPGGAPPPLPTAPTEEAAGNAVAQALESKRAGQASGARSAYSRLEDIEADPANTQTVKIGERTIDTGVLDKDGQPITRTEPITKDIAVPVDMTPAIKALKPIYDRLSEELPIAQRQASPGFTAIKNIVEGDTTVPASVAEANLGAVKQIQRETVSPKSKFLASQAVDAMRPVVEDAVSAAGDDAITALKEGRALTRAKYATQATIDQLPTEPVKLFNKLTANEDTNINLLRDVQQKAPGSMPALGRAVLQGLVDSATASEGARPGTAFSNWGKVGDATKQILFPDPAIRKGIDNFFALARKVAADPNPSGSAVVAYSMAPAGLMIHNPIAGTTMLLSGYGAAKLLNSAAGIRLLTQGLRVPLRAPAVSAGLAAQITKMAGADAKPFIVPKAAENETPDYKEGQTVKLADGSVVTIKKIDPATGNFEY